MNLDYLITTLGARQRGRSYFFKCAAHGGSSPDSGSLQDGGDRALLICRKGCPTEDVLRAYNLSRSDLFADTSSLAPAQRIEQERRRAAANALEEWRQSEILKLAANLRLRDELAGAIGGMTGDAADEIRGLVYRDYSFLEYVFDCLRRGENVLGIWRMSRRAAA